MSLRAFLLNRGFDCEEAAIVARYMRAVVGQIMKKQALGLTGEKLHCTDYNDLSKPLGRDVFKPVVVQDVKSNG